MKTGLKKLKFIPKDEQVKRAWWWANWLIVVNVILTTVFFWQLPKQIPLFYSRPEGWEQLAEKWWIWLLPGLGILFGVMMNVLMQVMDEEMLVLKRLLVWFLALICLLLVIGLAHILVIIL